MSGPSGGERIGPARPPADGDYLVAVEAAAVVGHDGCEVVTAERVGEGGDDGGAIGAVDDLAEARSTVEQLDELGGVEGPAARRIEFVGGGACGRVVTQPQAAINVLGNRRGGGIGGGGAGRPSASEVEDVGPRALSVGDVRRLHPRQGWHVEQYIDAVGAGADCGPRAAADGILPSPGNVLASDSRGGQGLVRQGDGDEFRGRNVAGPETDGERIDGPEQATAD